MSVTSELTWVLFDHDGSYFGELKTRGGAFVAAAFSEAGEKKIGPSLHEWQTYGVTVLREAMQMKTDEATSILYEDRVPLRSAECLHAISRWAEFQRVHIISLATFLDVGIAIEPEKKLRPHTVQTSSEPMEIEGFEAMDIDVALLREYLHTVFPTTVGRIRLDPQHSFLETPGLEDKIRLAQCHIFSDERMPQIEILNSKCTDLDGEYALREFLGPMATYFKVFLERHNGHVQKTARSYSMDPVMTRYRLARAKRFVELVPDLLLRDRLKTVLDSALLTTATASVEHNGMDGDAKQVLVVWDHLVKQLRLICEDAVSEHESAESLAVLSKRLCEFIERYEELSETEQKKIRVILLRTTPYQ